MTMTRDFLTPQATQGSSNDQLAAAFTRAQYQQLDYLERILEELKRQNPAVKAVAKVSGTNQNSITDTNQHEVTFQVGGAPVLIYRLLMFSSYDQTISVNDGPLSNNLDGIQFAAGNLLDLAFPGGLKSIWIKAEALSNSALQVNGSADPAHGGFLAYGWTTDFRATVSVNAMGG